MQHKLPKNKQEKQALLNDEEFVQRWVSIAESEVFENAINLCIDKIIESHPPENDYPHIHAHNMSTVNSAYLLKRLFIEGALEAKYKEEIIDDETPKLM